MKQTLKIGDKVKVRGTDIKFVINYIGKNGYGEYLYFKNKDWVMGYTQKQLQLIKSKTKKVKKYKYSRKEWFKKYGMFINGYNVSKLQSEAYTDLLATQPQPKDYIEETTKYSKKDFDYLSKSLKLSKQEESKDIEKLDLLDDKMRTGNPIPEFVRYNSLAEKLNEVIDTLNSLIKK